MWHGSEAHGLSKDYMCHRNHALVSDSSALGLECGVVQKSLTPSF